jgi:hypothetical protein
VPDEVKPRAIGRRNSIYGWFAKNGRNGRSGRWHAHTAFGRSLCPKFMRTTESSFGWLSRERGDRPPKAETCPSCWELPDDGTPIAQ